MVPEGFQPIDPSASTTTSLKCNDIIIIICNIIYNIIIIMLLNDKTEKKNTSHFTLLIGENERDFLGDVQPRDVGFD